MGLGAIIGNDLSWQYGVNVIEEHGNEISGSVLEQIFVDQIIVTDDLLALNWILIVLETLNE